MKSTSGISTAALLALMLVGVSSRAQEASGSASASSNDTSPAATSETSNTTPGNSKVRIVRLSEIKGEVQLDRNTGRGFESAMANLPVTEGAKLKTGDGVAEVEFEDNSTVRIGQNSLVQFPLLELLPSGAKSSAVNVLQGMIYVNLMNTKGNEFTVAFGQEKLNLPPDSHVRLQLTPSEASLAVLHGEATVNEPSGSTVVGKNKTMTFNLASQSPPVIAKSVAQEPLDSWDNEAVQYHKSYANASSFGNSPYAYGINDMNYYGSFVNAAGCGGSMWRPYFTSASWDPFGNGAWAYYPSAGYSWVSPYPWGWTPYHSGSWAFCQGLGWGWQPGGAWVGLANNSFVGAGTTRPRPPSRAPLSGQSTLVQVNRQPLASSGLNGHDTFVFRKDSAGLGVPRGSLGKLNSYSGQAMEHGMAATNVYYPSRHGGAEGEGHIAPARSAPSAGSYSNSSSMSNASAPGPSRGPSGPSGGGSGHR